MTKDQTNDEIIESVGSVFPDKTNWVTSLSNEVPKSLIDILREFGVMGVVTYVGGTIMLIMFPVQVDFGKQILYALSGLSLLFLATFISYHRINAQKEMNKSLIEMTQNANNRLAEQLGKGLTEKQIFGIIQKIRQNQQDLFAVIFNHSIEK